MSLTNKEKELALRLKSLVKEGRLFSVDDAIGLLIMLRTDEEIDLMKKFLDDNPQCDHDDILEYALKIKNVGKK